MQLFCASKQILVPRRQAATGNIKLRTMAADNDLDQQHTLHHYSTGVLTGRATRRSSSSRVASSSSGSSRCARSGGSSGSATTCRGGRCSGTCTTKKVVVVWFGLHKLCGFIYHIMKLARQTDRANDEHDADAPARPVVAQ